MNHNMTERESLDSINTNYKYGFSDQEDYLYKSGLGLTPQLIVEMSRLKGEPEWMLEKRLQAYEVFLSKPMPTWGADLSGVHFDDIHYYVRPSERAVTNWDEVPDKIKDTFDRLGVPEAERKHLAGLAALGGGGGNGRAHVAGADKADGIV